MPGPGGRWRSVKVEHNGYLDLRPPGSRRDPQWTLVATGQVAPFPASLLPGCQPACSSALPGAAAPARQPHRRLCRYRAGAMILPTPCHTTVSAALTGCRRGPRGPAKRRSGEPSPRSRPPAAVAARNFFERFAYAVTGARAPRVVTGYYEPERRRLPRRRIRVPLTAGRRSGDGHLGDFRADSPATVSPGGRWRLASPPARRSMPGARRGPLV
jgi:hypothetical protein